MRCRRRFLNRIEEGLALAKLLEGSLEEASVCPGSRELDSRLARSLNVAKQPPVKKEWLSTGEGNGLKSVSCSSVNNLKNLFLGEGLSRERCAGHGALLALGFAGRRYLDDDLSGQAALEEFLCQAHDVLAEMNGTLGSQAADLTIQVTEKLATIHFPVSRWWPPLVSCCEAAYGVEMAIQKRAYPAKLLWRDKNKAAAAYI